MKIKLNKKIILKYALLVFGCVIYSLGTAVFLDANNLAAGGVTGIAIIISHLSGMDTGILILLFNIPLLILGTVFFGWKFTLSTLVSIAISSGLIYLWNFVFDAYLPLTDNLIIAAVCGGALFGIGLGLIFRAGSTTGGTDIIVKILRRKFRHIRTGVISMSIDVAIIALSVAVYQDFELLFYTVASIVVFTLSFDWMLYGGNAAKLIYIITTNECSVIITQKILKELDISATLVDGTGAYTGNDRCVIMCAAKNILFPKLRDIVREADPKAFMIVSSAKEIYGEGYKAHTDEDI